MGNQYYTRLAQAAESIMLALEARGLAESSLKNYRNTLSVFLKYAEENDITELNDEICFAYIKAKTTIEVSSMSEQKLSEKAKRIIRPLHQMLVYLKDEDSYTFTKRCTKAEFVCPVQFQAEYEAYRRYCETRGYAASTHVSVLSKIQQLLHFLNISGVRHSSDITVGDIEKFLRQHEDYAVKYIGVYLYVFRRYLNFLHGNGFITDDIVSKLPGIRMMRNAEIPYAWKKEDIIKLLDAVDRADPKGKRDYAILLLAVKLGLRVSDIRNLTLNSVDWIRRTLTFVTQKTVREEKLPLPADVGWAIIDYLRNGRPKTSSDRLFVSHRPPFMSFGDSNSFHKSIDRYIIKAGISMPPGNRHGMHSLRSTLARNMLGTGAALPVISETLGHVNPETTSIYLKIDIEGLRRCALDPEVFE